MGRALRLCESNRSAQKPESWAGYSLDRRLSKRLWRLPTAMPELRDEVFL
jgi:hypothetical protein